MYSVGHLVYKMTDSGLPLDAQLGNKLLILNLKTKHKSWQNILETNNNAHLSYNKIDVKLRNVCKFELEPIKNAGT